MRFPSIQWPRGIVRRGTVPVRDTCSGTRRRWSSLRRADHPEEHLAGCTGRIRIAAQPLAALFVLLALLGLFGQWIFQRLLAARR